MTLTSWPDPSTREFAAFIGNGKALVKAFLAENVIQPIIIAALANGERETEIDPNARGDYLDAAGRPLKWSPHPVGTPTSFGLFQHKDSRLGVIKAQTGLDIKRAVLAGTNTVENDVAAALWEFRNIKRFGWQAMQGQLSYSAARTWCQEFEQAGAPDALNLSGEMALRWFANRALVGL